MPKVKFKWTEEQIALLGQMPDGKLAERLGIAPNLVRSNRERRGIPIDRVHPPTHEFTPQQDELLGTKLDTHIARMTGIPLANVRQRRRYLKIPAFRPYGVMVEISAEKLKARRTAVGLLPKDMVSKETQTGAYRQLERGYYKLVLLGRLEKFAQILQCSVSDLMPSKPDTDDDR